MTGSSRLAPIGRRHANNRYRRKGAIRRGSRQNAGFRPTKPARNPVTASNKRSIVMMTYSAIAGSRPKTLQMVTFFGTATASRRSSPYTREPMRFKWDEKKRLSNIAKHGFDFIRAARLFDGRHRLDAQSPRGPEHRILSIGELDGV